MSKVLRYELQWDEETHTLARRAAHAAGFGSIKAYVSQLVRRDAPAVLENYDKIVLSNQQFDAFCEICENPPMPSPAIRKAAEALDKEGFFADEGG